MQADKDSRQNFIDTQWTEMGGNKKASPKEGSLSLNHHSLI